jgi:hypothetical protein
MEQYAIIPPETKKTEDLEIPSHLFQVPFRLTVYGASASGKGVMLNNLIASKRFPYRGIFKKNVFIFSETISLGDPSFADLDYLTEDRFIKGYDEKVVAAIWDEQNEIIKKHGKPKAPHVLLLFDDTVTSITSSPSSLLRKLFFQGRHSKISTIVTSQHYAALPRSVRLNADSSVVFDTNKKQAMTMADEQAIETDAFIEILRAATEEPYSFLVIMYKHPIASRYQLRFTGKYYTIER